MGMKAFGKLFKQSLNANLFRKNSQFVIIPLHISSDHRNSHLGLSNEFFKHHNTSNLLETILNKTTSVKFLSEQQFSRHFIAKL